MKNMRPATNPLNINLPDGMMVISTHLCNLEIPGLPYVLEGHIVPDLTVALLIGIRILCEMGCIIVFTDTACYVRYQGKVILTGYKDPSMDLWVLPITPDAIKSHEIQLRTGPSMARAPQSPVTLPTPPQCMDGAMFMHSMQTQANTVKFAHQAMCNPKILSLLKALQKGYLKECPNLSEGLVTKYLNPSPATAKGHMKRPKKGIWSTRKKVTTKGENNVPSVPAPVPQVVPPPLPLFVEPLPYNGPAYGARMDVNLIPDEKLIANVFCFGAFAHKINGVVYNDLTGNFPFMSIDGSVCFFVLYHYETNAIPVKPIANVDNRSIFEAYKRGIRDIGSKEIQAKNECYG